MRFKASEKKNNESETKIVSACRKTRLFVERTGDVKLQSFAEGCLYSSSYMQQAKKKNNVEVFPVWYISIDSHFLGSIALFL